MIVQIGPWEFVFSLITAMSIFGIAVSWLVRLQGRQETHEEVCAERYKQIAEQHIALVKGIESTNAKLDRLLESR